jgi:hypothetical protein
MPATGIPHHFSASRQAESGGMPTRIFRISANAGRARLSTVALRDER